MNIFAISDLHLPAKDKPMDVFGVHWENHFERISDDWQSRVTAEDIVLLPGDLTWAMRLDEALEDISRVSLLPGRKIILRGNHDYWWSSIGRVRRSLPSGTYAIQNDCVMLGGVLFAGSRGWIMPSAGDDDDKRIFARERLRLEMSLKSARRQSRDARLIVMMHYPPFTQADEGFSDLISLYEASDCVYGHLHGAGLNNACAPMKNGVRYHQASCDGLDFKLYELPSS